MKKMKHYKISLLILPLLFMMLANGAMAQEDSVPPKELVKLRYFNENNAVQYLILQNQLKTGKKIEPLANKIFQLYLDSNKAENLIGKITTDNKGKAKSFLPPSLQAAWMKAPVHNFIAVAAGKEDETIAELEITKSKIKIDTASADGKRSITVEVMKFENNEWVAAKDVEMKIGIHRLGSILSAGDQETYTTDSTGTATVEVNKDSLPGDEKGNIVLMARAEDNDMFGNLMVEKNVPWGVPLKVDNSFFSQRTLWTTRFRTPLWLLLMAYSIVIGVWGTIIYLITRIVKVKKLSVNQG